MMPTTEATDRVELVFSLFDADGNGYLEPADFSLMSERVVAAVPAADDARKNRLTGAFHRYGETLLTELDANGDGRISPEEFTSVVLNPQRFDATVDEFAEALAEMGDPDGDGFVARPEFVALMLAIGFARPNIEALFQAFGPDREDRVRVSTWADAIRDYYRPEKSGIAGDHLVPANTR
ncbi:EF-hand domain-containing protein [Streptomyces sp. SID5910]|uniref:EF-hand domain-containing protein n=1 Tax=Streptomyces sp. SID5910 TaxID=2690312 RepID=UPI001372178E|nr:EF-hand domain-containing protein [Streptomyces sp. SID5910]MYR41923.1 calcium-binding protein [Streptomyces sp. SID5910]